MYPRDDKDVTSIRVIWSKCRSLALIAVQEIEQNVSIGSDVAIGSRERCSELRMECESRLSNLAKSTVMKHRQRSCFGSLMD